MGQTTVVSRLAFALAAIFLIGLATLTAGSNDLLYFESFLAALERDGLESLYRNGAPLLRAHPDYRAEMIHPPAVIAFLKSVAWISVTTGIAFHVVFRLVTSAAHLAAAVVVSKLFGQAGAVWVVLAPASLFIGGFHGNTDTIAAMFVLLAILAAKDPRSPVWTGIWIGAACSVKIWPLLLGCAFLLDAPDWKHRARILVSAAATALLLAAPYLYQEPRAILSAVFGYRSAPGIWGLTILLPEYSAWGTKLVITWSVLGALWARYQGFSLYGSAALILTGFFAFAPGFGVQYLAWLTPFCLEFPPVTRAAVLVMTGLFSGALYTQWSGGIPWDSADSLARGLTYGLPMIVLSFSTWAVLVAALWERLLGSPQRTFTRAR